MKNILFATQAVIEKNMMKREEYLSKMKEYITSLKGLDIKITIKLHPQEKLIDEYKKIVKETGINAIVVQSGSKHFLEELIESADIVMTFKSSVLIMAMLMKKPVISIDMLDKIHDLNDYYFSEKEDNAVLKTNGKDVRKKVNKLLNDKKFKNKIVQRQSNYIKDYFFRVDGLAYRRIADVIERLVN